MKAVDLSLVFNHNIRQRCDYSNVFELREMLAPVVVAADYSDYRDYDKNAPAIV